MNADPRDDHAGTDEPEDVGGDPVCWAQFVCQECGAMTTEGHRDGCESAR